MRTTKLVTAEPAKVSKKKKQSQKAPKAPKPEKKVKTTIPKAGDYLKLLCGMKGVEEGSFAFFSDELAWTSSVKERLPTGSLAIDRLLDGGWPVGRLVEVASWESVGKTTLLDQSLAQVQRMGGVGVLIDSEQARDERYTAALGVNLDELLVHKALTIEEAFAGIDRVVALQEAQTKLLAAKGLEPPPMLVVWDSLGGTPSHGEFHGDSGDKHVADAARTIKLNMRRLTQRIAGIRICIVFANQFYAGIGPFSSLNTYGGSGIRYFTSIRLWLTRTGQLKIGEHVVGHSIEAKLKKTRISRPRPPAEVGLIYGAGLHNSFTLFEWGKSHGVTPDHKWIKQAGGWCWLIDPSQPKEGIAFQRTFLGLGELLTERPDLYVAMVEAYRKESEVLL